MQLTDRINYIHEQFGKIIPDKAEKVLTLVLLQEWIGRGKIEAKFTEFDVNRAFAEVVEITGREKNIAVARPIRDLRKFYLLYFRKEDKYKLSQYAENFIRLLNEEIDKAYNPESLKISFRRTFLLKDEDFESIDTFKVWYEDKFLNTTKGKISAVIDALHQDIINKNDELNQVFKESEDFETQLSLFLSRFKAIKERFTDIEETILMRNEVISALKQGNERFTDSREWMEYDSIRSDIESFFDYIDSRLDELRLNIDQAVKQVSNLYKNFEFKRLFKVRMEKFLHLLLNRSENKNGKVSLPEGMETKLLPSSKPSLLMVPAHLEMKNKRSEILDVLSDEGRLEAQREKQRRTLWRDQRTAHWAAKIREVLQENERIDVDEWFYKVLDEDKDVEVSVNVVSKIMNEVKNNPQYKMEVSDPELATLKRKDIVVWKMKVQPSDS